MFDNVHKAYDKRKLPAKRYLDFQAVFENYVTTVQEKITALDKMRRLYNIVKFSLEKINMPNETRVSVEPTYISLTIVALPSDSLKTFEPIIRDIGHSLLDAKLHRDGTPSHRAGGPYPLIFKTWSLVNGVEILLSIECPENGLTDIEFLKVTQTYSNTYYDMIERRPCVTKETEYEEIIHRKSEITWD
jgi:hypothetical protein